MVGSDSGKIVKSARRAFDILEILEEERRPLGLSEIVALTGFPTSSTAALLKSLVSLGYLEYDRPRRSYVPTMRIAVLGQWVQHMLFGDGGALRAAEDLNRVVGLPVFFGAQSDLKAQYFHVVGSQEPLRGLARPGSLRPLAASAIGLMLLSAKPDQEVRKLLRRVAASYPQEAASFVDVAVTLREIRVRGYFVSRGLVAPGMGMIARLLKKPLKERTVAVSIAGPLEDIEQREEFLIGELGRFVDKVDEQQPL